MYKIIAFLGIPIRQKSCGQLINTIVCIDKCTDKCYNFTRYISYEIYCTDIRTNVHRRLIFIDCGLYYEEKGDGFPLIFLHGNGENHEYFIHQTEFFSHYYRVITPDTRGHGKSPRGDGAFTLKRFAEDLHDFMTALGIQKAHISGFSDGGNIALYFALKYPFMIEKLVLNGANISPQGVKRKVQIPIEIGYRIALRHADKSAKAKINAEMLALMVNEPDISVDDLNKIRIPTLVIAGTRDMIKRTHTELITKNIPGAELKFIKGNHFVANKNYNAFNNAVYNFLCKQHSE